MTPAEIAALRERLGILRTRHRCLAEGIVGAEVHCVAADGFDAALALLDAQAAEIARLTAGRERAWADGIEEAAWHLEWMQRGVAAHHIPVLNAAAERIRALAPAPAGERGRE